MLVRLKLDLNRENLIKYYNKLILSYKSYKERRTENKQGKGRENTIFGQGVNFHSVSAFA